MFQTLIAGSLPKPSWLAETHKLWPQWRLQGTELAQAKLDATLLWIKAQEEAGLDVIGDGEQSRQHFVHGFLERVQGIDFEHKVEMGIRNDRYKAMVPQVVGPLKLSGRVHDVEAQFLRAHTQRKTKFTLPGPMTIVDTVADRFYGDRFKLAMAFAEWVGILWVSGLGMWWFPGTDRWFWGWVGQMAYGALMVLSLIHASLAVRKTLPTWVIACLMLATQAEGCTIETVEGLAASADELSVLQQSFWDLHGLQCGFCTPGMMLAAKALLDENPNPTEEDIRWALSGNLCRCTGYQNIVKSVLWAAEKMRADAGQE